MRIALTMAFLSVYSGGLAESVPILSAALRRSGVESFIVGLDDPAAPQAAGFTGDGVLAHAPLGPRSFGYGRGFAASLGALDPDVVDTQHLWMFPSLAALGWHRRSGRPLVVTPRGMLDRWALERSGWKKRIVRRWFEDAHLAASACLRALCVPEARAIREFGIGKPVFVVPNAIPVSGPVTPVPSVGRRKLLFLGRIDEKKGVRQLLDAWRMVANLGPDWCLEIVGWGNADLIASLKASVGGPGAERVIFAGPKFGAEKDAAFREASAFILPSLSEGLPMVVLEAWRAGRPAVITDACNLPEGFAAGAALRIGAEPSSIADGIVRVFETPSDQLHRIGLAGRALVETRFSTQRMGDDMRRIYAWTIGAGSRPEDLVVD